MNKKTCIALMVLSTFLLSGCAPLIIGAAVGGAAAYAVSTDTVLGNTDKVYANVWNSAMNVSKVRGTIRKDDVAKGAIEVDVEKSRVWIRLTRVTDATTQVQVSARKYHMPDLGLAQSIFIKIIEGTLEQ